jgi:ATP-binding cassette subfamily C protein CydC
MNEMRRLVRLFAAQKGWMLSGLAIACVTVMANFWLMTLSGWFLASTGIVGLSSFAVQNQFNFFTPAASVRFFATLRVGARYGERLVTHEATFRLLAELRAWFFGRLVPLAPAGLKDQRTGDLLARLSGDIDTLNLFYLRVYVPALAAGITVGLMTLFFAWFSGWAALWLLVGLGLNGVAVPMLTARLGHKAGAEVTRTMAALRTHYVEAAQSLPELLTYGAAPGALAEAAALNGRLQAAQGRMAGYAGLSLAASGLATNFTLLAVLVAGIKAVTGAGLNPADLALLALGAVAAFEAVAPLPQAFAQYGQIKAAARRVFEVADLPVPVAEPAVTAARPARFDLALEGVSLRYGADRPWALEDVTLRVAEGQRIGVIGPTGAGKSTLINLLLRFYEYQAGSARLGGQELRNFTPEQMARLVTVVSQRSHLFHTTIRDNLLLARGDADEAALMNALEVAQLADFVRGLPEGLDTVVGEAGIALSGGQGRRIALARAVLRPTPWLILDEPTEGLDAGTEAAFLRDLAPVLAGRTVLVITHRPAPLALVDEVWRLEAGRLMAGPAVAALHKA